jgi:hypothetical protein
MAVMSHYSRVLKIVIDAPPDLHDQELALWQDALGQELPEVYSAEYHGAFLRGSDLILLMQRLESGAPSCGSSSRQQTRTSALTLCRREKGRSHGRHRAHPELG